MRVGGNVTLTTRRTAGTGDPVVGSVTAGWKDSVCNGIGFCLNKASTGMSHTSARVSVVAEKIYKCVRLFF